MEHHVQHHAVVAAVGVVAVGLPAASAQVQLDVAAHDLAGLALQDGVAEVRPRGGAGPAGVDDAQPRAVVALERRQRRPVVAPVLREGALQRRRLAGPLPNVEHRPRFSRKARPPAAPARTTPRRR